MFVSCQLDGRLDVLTGSTNNLEVGARTALCCEANNIAFRFDKVDICISFVEEKD